MIFGADKDLTVKLFQLVEEIQGNWKVSVTHTRGLQKLLIYLLHTSLYTEYPRIYRKENHVM